MFNSYTSPETFVEFRLSVKNLVGRVNFRNSDCATVRVDYIKMSTMNCVANTTFLTLG